MNLAIFDLQVTLMLPTEFQVNWLFVQKKWKAVFQDGCHSDHLRFPIWTILAIFLSTSARWFLLIFMSIGFRFRRNKKIVFQDVSTAAILNIRLEWFWLFLIYKLPQCFLLSFKSIGLWVQAKGKIVAAILNFWFELQSTLVISNLTGPDKNVWVISFRDNQIVTS